MKKRKWIAALIFTIFIIAGCGGGTDESEPNSETTEEGTNQNQDQPTNGTDTEDQEITVNEIDYELIDPGELDPKIQQDIETLKMKRGYYYWKAEEEPYIIFIGAGEKNTGGYGLDVLSVGDQEGKTVITVEQTEPEPESMVTEVLTYPYVVIQVEGVTENFQVKEENGSEYPYIDLANDLDSNEQGTMLGSDENPIDFSKPVIGIYQGQIDNNSIEVKVQDTYLAVRTGEVREQLEDLETGDTVEMTLTVSPSDQLIASEIKKME